MSTVDIQETLKTQGNTNMLDKISEITTQQCVTKNISTTDGRDLTRINSIKIHANINVYTVSLVNTNLTKDSSSNSTVYDNNRHLNADYNC